MSVEGQKLYPGDEATPRQILMLADEYRRAASALLPTVRRRKPLSRAPYRLVALQAIELYLNALMLHRGYPAARLRALQHNMAPRALFAKTAGLSLRKATFEHLLELAETREYLVSRYGPEFSSSLSQLTRLAATLREIAEKVTVILDRGPP